MYTSFLVVSFLYFNLGLHHFILLDNRTVSPLVTVWMTERIQRHLCCCSDGIMKYTKAWNI